MSASKFEMHLIVPAKLVGTIVELMEGEGVLVSMNPHNDKKKQHYANGKKNKGISGSDAALEILSASGKPMTYKQVGKLMASKYNFSESSASPALSVLAKSKKVIRKDDLYSIAK